MIQTIRVATLLASVCCSLTASALNEPESSLSSATPVNTAQFEVRHELKIPVPQNAQRVRAWFVLPMNEPMQQTTDLQIRSNLAHRITQDTKTGNRYVYLEARNPNESSFDVVATFRVTRREVRHEIDPARTRPLTDAERNQLAEYLAPTRHAVINDEIRKLAAEIVGEETNPVLQARKIYDWVLHNIEYWVKQPDKLKASPVGSTEYCLETRTGNCTDFHSLYASLAQAAGIPIRLVYGSLFKAELDGVDQDASYHCWVEFYAPNLGWLPLDVAVADIYVGGFDVNDANGKLVGLTTPDGYRGAEPDKVDYYFGNLDERRVALALGRDLTLVPPQEGEKVNAMPKAHVEIDGKPVSDFVRKLTFRQLSPQRAQAPPASQRKSREFLFTYSATVTGLEKGQTARIWLPVPPSNSDQQVTMQKSDLPAEGKIGEEPTHGNRMLFLEAKANDDGQIPVSVVYRVQRHEVTVSPSDRARAEEIALYLQPDAKVPVGGKPLALIEGKQLPEDQLELGRVLYDTVNNHMRYSKDGTGWGQGDAEWACDSKFGNCTDFHSLFISLARSKKVPAKFEMGFPLPEERGKGVIPGYHCWAKFKPANRGWVPVDISEANKNPKMTDYYFGNLTEDRVVFTTGRDITLVPKQDGPPLNFFIYPYVEVDGKPHAADKVERKFSYEDVSGSR